MFDLNIYTILFCSAPIIIGAEVLAVQLALAEG